ncbi:mechanosensitive ion channel domain-containing protein [Halobacterium jilantaiense]|uniref:Mechanosensitive ion channel n=1 Tax=Halobacterium jilantaiense TaxID=355548 RepID=A0A1I0QRC1_9EURY|nr:mechanosensitive ion channel domain-containing protein [Halobacterium jilantaiense]SEW29440.1 Mechanosensitive ion channel [Halobacterium jilantaiense]
MAIQTSAVVEEAFAEFVDSVTGAVPNVLAGVVFLVLAAVTVRVLVTVVRAVLRRTFADQPVYVQLGSTLASIALWFGVLLAFLSAVGLPEIAAALGTASGFLALGVSYALSGMLADAVAGLYLLRDPDFNPGDQVTTGDVTGTVTAIELRKTRFDVDGDTVVRANADVEKKWTKRAE